MLKHSRHAAADLGSEQSGRFTVAAPSGAVVPALGAQVPVVGVHVAQVQSLGQILGVLVAVAQSDEMARAGLKSGASGVTPRVGMCARISAAVSL